MVKALQYKTFGKPDVLQLVDLPLVHPKADEVSIKVSHVGLNPMDWAIMGNPEVAPNFGVKLPQTFAYDFAGIIDEIGPEVTDFKVGDHVFGTTMRGAATEQLIFSTKERGLFHRPDFVEDDVTSTLAVAGHTAAVALRKAHVTAGDTLLVGGAAGGVGIFTVQLAQI
ncbi:MULTISPECIES: alcohol dehydrogenase catalytic domain-containing protein [Lactococcus]|nr:alcohol dehydrogenase catalytic domain-containing protein [Lactococcus lactis]MDS1013435.1 alcohol dehydrogenase catalytic domain-containing protein [Lactococcus lactis]WGU42636.1 alcohol dehydrogenase catalytic domain-containing protein [Lactococcus lactis subsp. lactis]